MDFVDAQHARALYIDLEWTCWDGPPPPGRKPEIIEVGVVEVDVHALTIVRELHFLVRPRHLDISNRCTRITGLTRDELGSAPRVNEVLDRLASGFFRAANICYAWGCDGEVLANACREHHARAPFRTVIDLSQLFRRMYHFVDQVSLVAAAAILGIQFEGVPHTALADARNLARAHIEIVRQLRSIGLRIPVRPGEPDASDEASTFGIKLRHALIRSKQNALDTHFAAEDLPPPD